MPELPLTTGHFGRPRLSLPPVSLVNAFVEPTPGGPTQDVRSSRPGLRRLYTTGSAPILRNYQMPGVFNGDAFSLSGGGLYRNSTLLGTVPYGPNPRMVAANDQLAIVTGGALYCYNGTTLSLVKFFDDGYSLLPPFSGVSVLYDIFVLPIVGSNQFYFSRVGDVTTINAANFSEAQTSPDPIVESAVLAEELYFFKPTATEIWDYTGQLTAPFAEAQGRTYIRGLAAQGSVTKTDNALFWVGDDLTVYRTGIVPQRISTPIIEDRLRTAGASAANCLALTFNIEGHVYYVLNIPSLGESYAYDCQTKQWFRWGSQSSSSSLPGLWLGSACAGVGANIQIGSAVDGRIFTPDPTLHSDDGAAIQVVVAGAVWFPEDKRRMNNVTLHMVRGVATAAIPDPIAEMRWSDDGGQTWTSWVQGSIGPIGGYRWKATWHSLGLMRQPGRDVEFRISDAVNVTIEGAAYNPGRP